MACFVIYVGDANKESSCCDKHEHLDQKDAETDLQSLLLIQQASDPVLAI
jgi:hypothetical protein